MAEETQPESLYPKPWDWADREAVSIVGRGSQILLPIGVERRPVSVSFPNRVDLVKAIAGALRNAQSTAWNDI